MTDPSPNTNYAHGPGGLFSSPALEGGRRRKSKSAQRRAEKAQRTFGGVKRADLPDSAFLDRARRAFPVMTAQDVRDAVSSWGRYQGPMTFDQFKRRLTRRARAIGASDALPEAWKEATARKAVQIDPEAHPGAMIALMLSPEQTAEITEGVPGRLAKEADHCTLIYLADDATAIEDRKAALLSTLAVFANLHEPIEVVTNGYGAFAGDDDRYPLVVLLNSPQLFWLRQGLFMRATGVAIPVEDRYGFTPHITLCYLPADTPMPRLARKKVTLRFDAISLIWAGERIDLPLLGKQPLQPYEVGEITSEKASSRPAGAPCGCSEGDDSATGAARLKTAPIASGGITTKPFASRAQQRWAFATNQDFAERWADETGSTAAFRRLPEKVARKSKSAARRLGLLDPAEMERAEKAGERIAGQLCRSKDGKFVNCNSKQATQESKDKLRKQAADQKKQEAAAERQAKRRENEKAVGEGAGLGASLSDALLEFASPDENITLAPQNAEALLAKGLIERNPDGSYRISGAGRSYIAAARVGDVSKARDAIGRGEDRAARRAATEQRRAAAEAKRLAKEQGKDPKEAKPKKGGGGGKGKDEKPAKLGTGNLRNAGPSGSSRPASGGGSSSSSRNAPEKKPAPTADERRAQAAQERESRARETAQRVGLADSAYDALRAAAEGQGGGSAALDALGLTSNGEATDQGRRALTALERGDVRTYQAALQDARNRLARESAAEERKREKVKRSHGYWKTYRKARADGLLPLEARKAAREQVLQTKMGRASRQRNALASALLGI